MPYAKIIGDTVALTNIYREGFTEVIEVPDGTFDNTAFEIQGNKVVVNFDKAKEQAHDMRRAKRDADMAPLDRQATYDMEGAEPLREDIRKENAKLQENIDKCKDVESLTELMQ